MIFFIFSQITQPLYPLTTLSQVWGGSSWPDPAVYISRSSNLTFFFKLITSEDCEGEAGCGVEAAELSSSESRLVARLWRDSDCDSLEFISASRVTCTHRAGSGSVCSAGAGSS